MEDEDIKCKECPSARHGFDRNASHNAGRYVCECESFVCPSEQLRQRVAELEQSLTRIVSYYDLSKSGPSLPSMTKQAIAEHENTMFGEARKVLKNGR